MVASKERCDEFGFIEKEPLVITLLDNTNYFPGDRRFMWQKITGFYTGELTPLPSEGNRRTIRIMNPSGGSILIHPFMKTKYHWALADGTPIALNRKGQEKFTVLLVRSTRAGYRDIEIYSPWSRFWDDRSLVGDVTLDDDPRGAINTSGGVRMTVGGNSDFWCNVGIKEIEILDFELRVAQTVCQNWTEFWRNPATVLKQIKVPSYIRFVVR